jgi:hypothetical protein
MVEASLADRLKELAKHLPEDLPTAKAMTIGGIPTGITENHNESLYFWQNLGLKGAVLLHVDAHDDLDDCAMPMESTGQRDYYKRLELDDFISAASYYGVIAPQIYFVNNQEPEHLRYASIELSAHLTKVGPFDRIKWTTDARKKYRSIAEIIGEQEQDERPLLLDVDLDSFSCCVQHPMGIRKYETYGYEGRIQETIGILRQLKRPSLITISRSQAHLGEGSETYVEPRLVDDVQQKFIEGLVQLYGEKILL